MLIISRRSPSQTATEQLVGLSSPNGNTAVMRDARANRIISEIKEETDVAATRKGMFFPKMNYYLRSHAAMFHQTSILCALQVNFTKKQMESKNSRFISFIMKNISVYIVFMIVVVAIGALIGVNNVADEWYQSLQKPSFNPPHWIFSPVWTTLYVSIGIAGARTWIVKPMGTRMRLWFTQMALNFLWSPIFFRMQSPVVGLVIIIPMLVCIVAFITLSFYRDKISMWLFMPYALWIAFATLLNLSICILN